MDKKLLELLVCPVTKGSLYYDSDKQELLSRSARLACAGLRPMTVGTKRSQEQAEGGQASPC